MFEWLDKEEYESILDVKTGWEERTYKSGIYAIFDKGVPIGIFGSKESAKRLLSIPF